MRKVVLVVYLCIVSPVLCQLPEALSLNNSMQNLKALLDRHGFADFRVKGDNLHSFLESKLQVISWDGCTVRMRATMEVYPSEVAQYATKSDNNSQEVLFDFGEVAPSKIAAPPPDNSVEWLGNSTEMWAKTRRGRQYIKVPIDSTDRAKQLAADLGAIATACEHGRSSVQTPSRPGLLPPNPPAAKSQAGISADPSSQSFEETMISLDELFHTSTGGIGRPFGEEAVRATALLSIRWHCRIKIVTLMRVPDPEGNHHSDQSGGSTHIERSDSERVLKKFEDELPLGDVDPQNIAAIDEGASEGFTVHLGSRGNCAAFISDIVGPETTADVRYFRDRASAERAAKELQYAAELCSQ